MSRTRARLHAALVVILAAALTLAQVAPAAAGVDLDGDSIFGPGERWERRDLAAGASGPWVHELQVALNRAGFRVEPVDGQFGPQTLAAVHAFQKLWGLERDGVFRTDYWSLLDEPLPVLVGQGEADRIEVDLDRQVLFLVQNGEVARVLPVSTGNGEPYVNSRGNLVRARTPEGRFQFYRQRSTWHRSYLGYMYAPFYFRGGYAIHGSSSVPAYPASHGCIRVTVSDMDFLRRHLELGMPVYIYGNRLARSDLLPAASEPLEFTGPLV